MRSRTLATLPGRCARCWLRDGHCVCAEVKPVATRTQVIVIRHHREAEKSTSTTRVAELALPHFRWVEYGEESGPVDALLPSVLDDAWLLFPTEGPEADLTTRPKQLVVLDGTWRQTRRMSRKLTRLHALPRLKLPTKAVVPMRLRESPHPEGRSTLEALADALQLLEGDAVAQPLHALHALYVERVFKARGVWGMKKDDFDATQDAE